MSKSKSLQLDKNALEQTKSQRHLRELGKIIIAISAGLLIFLILLSALMLGYEKYYQNKFLPGVKIDGVDLSGQSKEGAKILLQKKVAIWNNQSITLRADSEKKEVKIFNLAIDFKVDEAIDQGLNLLGDLNFFQRIFQELNILFYSRQLDLAMGFDNDKLSSQLNSVAPNLFKEAKDASISTSNGAIEIIAEEWGQIINLEKFKNDLTYNINNHRLTNEITLKTIEIEPKIKSWQLQVLKSQIEDLVEEEIMLFDEAKDQRYTISSSEIASWITLKDNQGQMGIDFSTGEIKSFIEQIAKKIDQKMIKKQINEENDQVLTEGKDGRYLDQDKLFEEINLIIHARKDKIPETNQEIKLTIEETAFTEERIKVSAAGPETGTPNLAEGKYIEINLSQQKMYLYNSADLQGSFTVSTGKWSMPTPEGTFYIQNKIDRAWSNKYKLYMPYWQSIGGGYGIHELPEWPNGTKEGEDHLGTPVSHGCIRLGVGPAETVYNWTEIGTVVFIHK